jgi:hypothetical protein
MRIYFLFDNVSKINLTGPSEWQFKQFIFILYNRQYPCLSKYTNKIRFSFYWLYKQKG